MEQKGWDLSAAGGTEQPPKLGDPSSGAVEAASPISCRPPAVAHRPFAQEVSDDVEELDRGVSGGNRWPRQETLALLKLRSEMDTAFRDSTLKGPLWEDVSRRLAQMGYKRSAKKCREKFENVYKYYRRTKEGRAGHQDGKSYKFFSQLEALQHASSSATAGNASIAAANLAAVPTGMAVNCSMQASSIVVSLPSPMLAQVHQPTAIHANPNYPSDFCDERTPSVPIVSAFDFSSDCTPSFSSSSSSGEEEEMEMVMEIQGKLEGKPENTNVLRKRKREWSSRRRMREFLEGLIEEVMQKQEAMQRRFLEAIEKREHDRMIREEAWKRQEMARLARDHEFMAKEQAISASRDAAIIAFLQKITGQTIHVPPPAAAAALITTTNPPPFNNIAPRPPQPPLAQKQSQSQPQQPELQHHPQGGQIAAQVLPKHPTFLSINSEIVAAADDVPADLEQLEMSSTGGTTGSLEATSSRWPKDEVLALIKLRSGLEWRFQEAGPKGPLWEEISAGMHQMGFKRSAKRCKEKWENINKYFKKVKESSKKRPQDSKTCPYFHQLDALYQQKVLGNTGGIATAGANTSTSGGN